MHLIMINIYCALEIEIGLQVNAYYYDNFIFAPKHKTKWVLNKCYRFALHMPALLKKYDNISARFIALRCIFLA